MASNDLKTIFRRTVRRHGMIGAGDRVGAAVSGGADSVALLHLLARHRAAWGFDLACVHVDHGLRGAESDADAAFVGDLAASLGVPFHLVRKRPREWKARGRSPEAAAREMRYAAFREVAQAQGLTKIATAHTASDQAETVLLNVLKGAGLDGLAGIPPVREDFFIRSLIDATRGQVIAFLEGERLAWREDSSNASRDFDRNRVRLDLLPALAREYNPRIEEALARLAAHARDDADVLRALALEFLGKHAREEDGGVVVPAAALAALPRGLRLRVYREAILECAGSLGGVTREHAEAIDRLAVGARTTGRQSLPGGWEARREADAVRLAPRESPREAFVRLDRIGARLCAELGWEFDVRPAASVPSKPWPADRTYVPAARLPELAVRTWRAGDRMRPEGMTGTKKVQDLFTDAKVPAYRRGRVPIVVCGDEPAWIVGLRRDRRFLPGRREKAVVGVVAQRRDGAATIPTSHFPAAFPTVSRKRFRP